MKIIAISDTHIESQHKLTEKLQSLHDTGEEFVLVHAGDALNYGDTIEAHKFLTWFAALPFKHKLFVPGNHDFCFDATHTRNYSKISASEVAQLYPSIKLLINDVIEIDGVTFAGVCAIPDLPNWAFYADERQRQRLFSLLPKADVLINHAPPLPFNGNHYYYNGCQYALDYAVRHEVQAYICGHLHECYGYSSVSGVSCYNVAIVNEHYRGCNEPTVIDIFRKDCSNA